ncbi:hypothetical protein HKCCE3408_10470 [Rhodobacterales bacterium HKCCE3408]|nr:hypothetical protein [Rhodobacterales bacterium HKCCE3408]
MHDLEMVAPASGPARALAGAIALLAFASLAAQALDLTLRLGLGAFEAVFTMTRYFTILTTALVALTFGAISVGLSNPRTKWLAQITLSDLFLTAVYHLLLRGLRDLDGLGTLADRGFHIVVPVLVAIWWFVFAPKTRLSLRHVPGLAWWPVLYTAYALTRGGLEGAFPYPFLDPLAIGWQPVLINIVEFTGVYFMAGCALVAYARLIER